MGSVLKNALVVVVLASLIGIKGYSSRYPQGRVETKEFQSPQLNVSSKAAITTRLPSGDLITAVPTSEPSSHYVTKTDSQGVSTLGSLVLYSNGDVYLRDPNNGNVLYGRFDSASNTVTIEDSYGYPLYRFYINSGQNLEPFVSSNILDDSSDTSGSKSHGHHKKKHITLKSHSLTSGNLILYGTGEVSLIDSKNGEVYKGRVNQRNGMVMIFDSSGTDLFNFSIEDLKDRFPKENEYISVDVQIDVPLEQRLGEDRVDVE